MTMAQDARSSFAGTVAIGTAASQGMGAAYARLLAERGAAVAVADIQAAKAADVAAGIAAAGGKAIAEMKEFILHFAVYCGWPLASSVEGAMWEAARELGLLEGNEADDYLKRQGVA